MGNVKETSWKVILTYLLVSAGMVSLINLVLFPNNFFAPLARATGNLLDATLQANLLSIAIFCAFVFVWGKLRPSDIGLKWNKLGQAIALTALLWVATQGIVLLLNWINGDIHLHPAWAERGVTSMIGGLLGQLLGNTLFEEMQYRGFYLAQFYLKIKGERWRQARAILLMLGLFILSHIPNRIFSGYQLADLPLDFALLFIWGLFFTAIYLLSGNLFLAVGVHALVNRPTLITEPTFPPEAILFFLTWIIIAVLRARFRRSTTVTVRSNS